MHKTRQLLIGIGNLYRRDDGVGIVLARRLKGKLPFKIVEEHGEGTALMELWKNQESVIVIDATSSKAKPGSVVCVDAIQNKMPQAFFRYSSHAFGLAEAIEMARALGELPKELFIYGIEGKDFSSGEGLSPEVEIAAKEVEEKILKEIARRDAGTDVHHFA